MAIKKFTLEIHNFDNEAMAEDPDSAIIEILGELLKRIENGGIYNAPAYLRDANGNKVGHTGIFTDDE